jgi:PAS domain S-box-containing protein
MIFDRLLNGVSSRLSLNTLPSDGSESETIINDILASAPGAPSAVAVSDFPAPSDKALVALDVDKYAASFLEYAPVTVFICDASGVFLYGNAMVEQMTGYSREDMIGKNFLNGTIVHADYLTQAAQLLVRSRFGRSTGPDEIKLVRKDGSSIWVELRTTPFNLDGRQMSLGFVQDISDRKTAEEVLRKEKEKAASYFDIAGVIMLVIDADARVTGINKKGCDLLGYDRDELIGKNWFMTCLPEELRERVNAKYRELIKGKVEWDDYHENLVLTRNGRVRNIGWRSTVLKDEYGKIVGMLSSGEDITERKLLEEQLFRLSSAISFSHDCIIITDANAVIIDVNSQAMALYGVAEKEEMVGRHILEFVAKEDRSRVNLDVSEILEKGYQESRVYNMVSVNGESYPVRMSTSLIMSADSTPMGMVRIYNKQ